MLGDEMNKQSGTKTGYDLASVKLPKLSGFVLRLLTGLMESPFQGLVKSSLLDKSGIGWFRRQSYNDPPTYYPSYKTSDQSTKNPAGQPVLSPSPVKTPEAGFHFNTIIDYAQAYSESKISPVDVARRLLNAIDESEKSDKPLRAFVSIDRNDILKQAEESAERYRQGKPLSILDGVPIPVKDQFDVKGYPTTAGTNFMGNKVSGQDSTVVARLHASGAIIAGKTNMHELGLGVTGINPHHGVARNPYNPGHHTGGSSSGSAAAVAAGFGPVSIGADGGGSIRIPSAFCGLVGLKPTYGRVSLQGDAQLCWSVEHAGPIAATATDAAVVYSVIAGPDPEDPLSSGQPPLELSGLDNIDMDGLVLGIYPEWFRHADPETVSSCENLLGKLEGLGITVREIAVPELEAARVALTITIAAEIAHSLERFRTEHHRDYGLDARLNLAIARTFTSFDYLKSQQVRTRAIREFNQVLGEVDLIVTPAAGIPAPPIPEKTLPQGESDLTAVFDIMRFSTPANLTGLPAISFPAGYTDKGLPVGMQAMGKAWDEKTLLRLALVAETLVERKAPAIYYDLLEGMR